MGSKNEGSTDPKSTSAEPIEDVSTEVSQVEDENLDNLAGGYENI